jgi:hypothetical protein
MVVRFGIAWNVPEVSPDHLGSIHRITGIIGI